MKTAAYRKGVGIVLLNQNKEVFIAHRHDKRLGTKFARSFITEADLKKIQENKILKDLEREGIPSLNDYLWQMPQGGIDEGEAPDQAAIRELKEETGIHSIRILQSSQEWLCYDIPEKLPPLKAWGGKFKGQCQKWFLMEFMGPKSEINLSCEEEEEFDAWRWITPEILPDLVVPFKRDLYKKVLQDFSLTAVEKNFK